MNDKMMKSSGVFWTCLSLGLLMVLVGVAAQTRTICGRYACRVNEYCYSPYPALSRCYPYRNYGQSCYTQGLYLCGPGLECAVTIREPGVCVYNMTGASDTFFLDEDEAGNFSDFFYD